MSKWTQSKAIFIPRNGEKISSFTCAAEPQNDTWRIWYSVYGADGSFNIGFGNGKVGEEFSRNDALRNKEKFDCGLNLIGLPEAWNPVQPVHIALPNGLERLYFWAHGDGVVRYLVADSNDGINYKVLNSYNPCLYHPNDRAVDFDLIGSAGLTIGKKKVQRPDFEAAAPEKLISNDATNVYLLPDGTFEMFTVGLIAVNKYDPRYVAHDNAAGLIRVIERRMSKDGINWSAGQRIIEPDEQDPVDLQFYYLAVTHTEQGRIGMLGHYRVEAQTMDIEFCFSQDGIIWDRPFRKPGFKRDAGIYGVYAPNSLVRKDDEWWMFYTSVNYTHNHGLASGPMESKIQLAKVNNIKN